MGKRLFDYYLMLMAVSAMLLVSCDDELGHGRDTMRLHDKNTVSFIVSNGGATRAEELVRTLVAPQATIDLLGEDDGHALSLVETVTSIDEPFVDAVNSTRGTPVYTENLSNQYEAIQAIAYKGSDVYLDAADFTLATGSTTNEWVYTYPDGVRWPEGDAPLLFFLQAPSSLTGVSNLTRNATDNKIAFDYTSPTSGTAGIDAEVQEDILFTTRHLKESTKDTDNRILLYHALTAVKFKAGIVDGGVTTITKVTIRQLASTGHCTITPSYEGDTFDKSNKNKGTEKSAVCSVWTSLGTPKDFTQTFDGIVTYDPTANTNSFAQSFYDSTTAEYNLNDAEASQTFLLIPQSKNTVEFVVDFTITRDGVTTPYRRVAKAAIDWKAGELHTYTLTVNKVNVTVTDEVSGKTKSDIVTCNTGNVPAYLRATIVTAWFYGEDDDAVIVAPYEDDGTFVGLPGTDWVEGSDGYYYYLNPVAPGQPTGHALFTTFTAPYRVPPFSGAHLEMRILLQGVQYDNQKAKVTTAWGSVACKGDASTTIVSTLSNVIE